LRDRIGITTLILEVANDDGATKTMLMYKVFLSQSQLKEYVKLLTESGLLRYDFVTRTFKTTQKGLRFLNFYNKTDQLMMGDEEQQQVYVRKERKSVIQISLFTFYLPYLLEPRNFREF
jgi:predicted transcriptional regulator